MKTGREVVGVENILEIARDGGLAIPPAAIAELGWGSGAKVLLRRTGDGFTLQPLPMNAQAGAREIQKTVADLRGEMVHERDTGELHRLEP